MSRSWYALMVVASVINVQGCSKVSPNAASSKVDEAWDAANDPAIFGITTKKFSEIPTSGMLADSVYPWSDFYWATYTGGLAYRWQDSQTDSEDYKAYRYNLLNKERVMAMNQEELDHLSPAEKYDISQDRYDFPLVKEEWQQQESAKDSSGAVPTWYGLCHGWAPATLMEPEPGAASQVVNADGIKVNFFTGDMKALITKVYADASTETATIGERCNTASDAIRFDKSGRIMESACRDVNPGSLHLILAQMLGNADAKKRKGFVMDMTYSAEVWNQAVAGYKIVSSKVSAYDPSQDKRAKFRAPGTAKLVDVQAEVYYIGEISPSLTPELKERNDYTQTMKLAYSLELDSSDRIIGGEWATPDHPDFLWLLKQRPELTDGPILSDLVFDIAAKSHHR